MRQTAACLVGLLALTALLPPWPVSAQECYELRAIASLNLSPPANYAQGVALRAGFAYVADGEPGVASVDVHDPQVLSLRSRLHTNPGFMKRDCAVFLLHAPPDDYYASREAQ